MKKIGWRKTIEFFLNGSSSSLYFDKKQFIKIHKENKGSIEQDWLNVGNDIKKSMNKYGSEFHINR